MSLQQVPSLRIKLWDWKQGGKAPLFKLRRACATLAPLVPTPLELSYLFYQLSAKIVIDYRVAALLEAKGGGRKGKFQGKAAKIERRNEVSEILKKEYSTIQ